jgi:hypothetical protein
VVRSLHRIFHSSFSLPCSAIIFIGLTSLQAQSPTQAPSQPSDQAPAPTSSGTPTGQSTDKAQPADNLPQPSSPSTSGTNHNSDAWKGLARDLEQAGMHRAGMHSGSGGAGEHNGPGGNRPGGPSGAALSGNGPSFGSNSQDSMHYGSEMKSNRGAGIGSSDFDSSTSNTLGTDTANPFGTGSPDTFTGNLGNPFGATSGNRFRGGQAGGFNPGSISQLTGDLDRGLASEGHTGAATALGTLPAANQFLRGNLNLPVNSSLGNFRLTYQSPYSLNNNFQLKENSGFGSPAAAYESPHVRSGHVDFSAYAKVGVGSPGMNGVGGNGENSFGSRTLGHPGSSDPSSSLTFKLSF